MKPWCLSGGKGYCPHRHDGSPSPPGRAPLALLPHAWLVANVKLPAAPRNGMRNADWCGLYWRTHTYIYIYIYIYIHIYIYIYVKQIHINVRISAILQYTIHTCNSKSTHNCMHILCTEYTKHRHYIVRVSALCAQQHYTVSHLAWHTATKKSPHKIQKSPHGM